MMKAVKRVVIFSSIEIFPIKFNLILFQSFHAELHQYKHNIDLFNQLTQRLIAVYQQDDTTRIKRLTEQINVRYANLTARYYIYIYMYTLSIIN